LTDSYILYLIYSQFMMHGQKNIKLLPLVFRYGILYALLLINMAHVRGETQGNSTCSIHSLGPKYSVLVNEQCLLNLRHKPTHLAYLTTLSTR